MRIRSRVSPTGIGETLFGFKMHCDTRDFIQRRVYHFKMYEPNLTYYILQNVRLGDDVVDIGANVGYITLLLSRIVGPTGKVTAIEAHPDTFAALSRNVALNDMKNVLALNMAATNGPCLVDIVTGEKNNSGSNSIRASSGDGTVSVKGDALSNLPQVDRDKVAFIKIDIEGSEGPVLSDLLENMDLYRGLRFIAAEVSPESAELIPALVAKGFRAFGLPNNYQIGYYFVRQYLRQSGEHGYVVKQAVDAYNPAFRDYVFERLHGTPGMQPRVSPASSEVLVEL
jgi:FkbM family methyltransferase